MKTYNIELSNEVEHGEDGFTVITSNGHRPQVGMGEYNWFPTRKEAQDYIDEIIEGE